MHKLEISATYRVFWLEGMDWFCSLITVCATNGLTLLHRGGFELRAACFSYLVLSYFVLDLYSQSDVLLHWHEDSPVSFEAGLQLVGYKQKESKTKKIEMEYSYGSTIYYRVENPANHIIQGDPNFASPSRAENRKASAKLTISPSDIFNL